MKDLATTILLHQRSTTQLAKLLWAMDEVIEKRMVIKNIIQKIEINHLSILILKFNQIW